MAKVLSTIKEAVAGAAAAGIAVGVAEGRGRLALTLSKKHGASPKPYDARMG